MPVEPNISSLSAATVLHRAPGVIYWAAGTTAASVRLPGRSGDSVPLVTAHLQGDEKQGLA